MNFFERLFISKQISFVNGEVKLLGNRAALISIDFLALYTLSISKDSSLVRLMYSTIKRTAREETGLTMAKAYSGNIPEYMKLMKEMGEISGSGTITINLDDIKAKRISMVIENSPICMYLKGKLDQPCNHIVRAVTAGNGSALFNTDVDVIETECIATGGRRCTLVSGTPDRLKKSYPELYELQVG